MIDDIEVMIKRAADRLKDVRVSTSLHQKDFAEMFGINPTTFNRYESGDIKKLPANVIKIICNKYGLNPAWLMGYEEAEKYMVSEKALQKTRRVPVFGSIVAGIPITEQEDLIDYEYTPGNLNVDFCVMINDDSLSGARIIQGDMVYIERNQSLANNDIALIEFNQEVLIRRVHKFDGGILLRAESKGYPDVTITKKNSRDMKVIGKAVLFRSEVR